MEESKAITPASIRFDSSWKSLIKAGGISSVLAGVCLILVVGFLLYLDSQLSIYNSTIVGRIPMVADYLRFVQFHAYFFYGWYISWALTALFALPVLFALFISLRTIDKGFALIGTALGVVGSGILLSNVSNHFYLISQAFVYNSGCTVCADQAVTAATATYASYTADSFAYLIFSVAVIMLSLVILKGGVFDKNLGFLGIGAALIGFVVSAINTNYYLGFFPYAAFAAWFIAIGYSLLRLSFSK